jgi:hypothetical protein
MQVQFDLLDKILYYSILQTDLQKWIGTVDVKSTPVHFYAQISTSFSTSFSTADNAIPFDSIKFNLGNGYSATGEFVAPTSGIYYFACSGVGFNLGNVINFSFQNGPM